VRGMADASLIAHLVSHKLDFHLPYYRQQSELSRYGLPISRANLCRWHFEAGALVEPIAKAMWEEALGRRWFAMDATSTAIFSKGKYRKGHIYVLVAPGDGVVFRYEPKYDGATVAKLFGGTEAVVVADACATNNPAFGPGKTRGSGCWSHARKRFVSAFDLGDKRGAAPGLQFIRELFRIEDEIALLSTEERLRIRQEKSAPIVAAFYEYIAAFSEVDSDAPMYEAVGYVTNQKEMLCRFLSNGEVPIHNNASERALRRIVKGRANWLFMFSDDHAEHTCALVSLLASCEPHGLDPEFYLQEVLTVAPSWPRSRALELSPKYWLQTRKQLIRDGALRYIDLGRISGSNLAFRPS
jgi:transposase